MNRRNFIKLCGVGVSGVLFAQLLPGCASDTAETAQILTSKSLTDSQREAIRNQLVECLDLTSNIGQYAEYPNLLLQLRGVLIITGYEFIEDSQLLKSWAADYMIEFRAEAYVRFNFDFYKSKTTITSVATPWTDIAQEYEKLSTASGYCTERSWEDCTNRLLTRGLLVSGSGETEYDALYDLLGSLSIIPTSGPFFLRLASFVKLTLLAHVPVSAARKLFQKDKRTKYETLVMRLAGQALLSTAEIIKCIDKNISRLPNECALLDSLYGDETTTSDNIASMVKISQSSKPVTLAVANLYLRQQIIFERV